MSFHFKTSAVIKSVFVLFAFVLHVSFIAPASFANSLTGESRARGLGIIKGIVRDDGGNPISDATVAIFKVGTSKLLKQVRSAADGSFLAKILPGTYTVLAVAQGYDAVTISQVEVGSAAQLTYGFKLTRAGSGNTLPERRLDRNNPKWVIRSAQTSRSVYQNTEGDSPVAESNENAVEVFESADSEPSGEGAGRKSQTVAQSFVAAGENGPYVGLNAATLIPVSHNAEIVLAGQVASGVNTPQRFEAQAKFRPADGHKIRLNTSVGILGSLKSEGEERSLGQFSFQALDEWNVREGVIVVFGIDYSRFFGAGDDFSVAPRIGFQMDLDSKTRFTTAYTTQAEERTWSQAIELEDAQVVFREPVSIEDIVVADGKPQMNKSRRLEFGIERVLDNSSSLAANLFFDATPGRGVGLVNLPFESTGEIFEFVGNQQGKAQGLSLVYTRRLSGRFATAAGYSFGSGQKLSGEGVSKPSELFQNDFFQSFYGQFEADLLPGTNVKTIFRLSPQATVFAIDPFKGRLAIYDPSLSVLVTQSLPNLGLPFHAQAVVDARNLFDFQAGVTGEDGGLLRLNSQRRAVRGSILVRF